MITGYSEKVNKIEGGRFLIEKICRLYHAPPPTRSGKLVFLFQSELQELDPEKAWLPYLQVKKWDNRPMNLTFVYYTIIVNNMEKVFNSTIAITNAF